MAFESGWIESDEDQRYVAMKGFKSILGRPFLDPGLWAIDRERDIIFICRGGGGLEMPKGYALYLDGEIINMEGEQRRQRSVEDNSFVANWKITKTEVPSALYRKGYQTEQLKMIIKEAMNSYSHVNVKSSEKIEVTVEFVSELVCITDNTKEE